MHGVTGILGALAIGVAASPFVYPDGPVGLLYGDSGQQLAIQAFGIAVAAAFAFGVSMAIFKIIDKTTGITCIRRRGRSGNRYNTACRKRIQ